MCSELITSSHVVGFKYVSIPCLKNHAASMVCSILQTREFATFSQGYLLFCNSSDLFPLAISSAIVDLETYRLSRASTISIRNGSGLNMV